MTYDGKKIIFQHRDLKKSAKIGLGVVSSDNFYDKGSYSFAVFKNIETVIPYQYGDIRFFANRGVPLKIEKGVYGDNILLKESYKTRTYIRAYKEDGSVGLFECDYIKNDKFEGENAYFSRLDNGLIEWVDITDNVVNSVVKSIETLTCDIDYDNSELESALKGIDRKNIYKLDSGVIVANGKFESLIIWNDTDVKMAWLGRKLDTVLIEK